MYCLAWVPALSAWAERVDGSWKRRGGGLSQRPGGSLLQAASRAWQHSRIRADAGSAHAAGGFAKPVGLDAVDDGPRGGMPLRDRGGNPHLADARKATSAAIRRRRRHIRYRRRALHSRNPFAVRRLKDRRIRREKHRL